MDMDMDSSSGSDDDNDDETSNSWNNNKNDNNNTAVKRCGVTEQFVFLIALVCGTACSICSKTMMELHGEGIDGDIELFEKPIFQTFGMFIGMLAGLVMHYIVLVFRIPFPGYNHNRDRDTATRKTTLRTTVPETCPPTPSPTITSKHHPTEKDLLLGSNVKATLYNISNRNTSEEDHLLAAASVKARISKNKSSDTTPIWMYFFLVIPSIFDLGATAFCMMGLVYLDVSIYQLLRGSGIIFVALMKQHCLGDRLYLFQWIGVFWNVISVLMVGATAMLNSADDARQVTMGQALLGVTLVLFGAFVQALQFVFEEKVMTMDEASVPPLLLIGMEGLWGTILCLVLVYPLCYFLPGDDHGSFEDPFNTWYMLIHNPTILWSFVVYFFAILGYNLFAVLVTYLLNSVWHAILDNFRPITVWGTDMFIFYCIVAGAAGGGDFGEPWTQYSWIQLLGMFVLLYGTAVYNAPNPGSVQLLGKWYHFFINCSNEYENIDFDTSWNKSTRSPIIGSIHSRV